VLKALSIIAGLAILPAAAAAVATGSAWQIDLVDQTGPGKSSSLKIDKNGNVHVAYVVDDGGTYPLKYAFWDHALKRWFVMAVAQNSGACSLALDSKQRPHISFVDYGTASGSKLRYAYWDGAAWQKQAIPLNSDIIAYFNSIALDANDRPSISFYEYRGPKESEIKIRLRMVTWTGEYWQVRTIDGEEGSGKFNSMAIDASGRIHIAYANVSANTAGLRYALWNGAAWKTEIVDTAPQNNGDAVGYSTCLALDKDGDPHIAYMNESNPGLKYAVHKGGQWRIFAVERLARIGYPDRNSIAVDENGRPYISYYDAGRGILRLAHVSGQKWMIETVDGNGAGFTSSVAIHDGAIWISYADDAGALKVAHRALQSDEALDASARAREGAR